MSSKNITPQQIAQLLSQLNPEQVKEFYQSQGVRFVPRPRVGTSTTRNGNLYLKVGSANLLKSNRGEGYLYWGARGRGSQPLLFNAGISKNGNAVIISASIEVNATEAQMCRDFFNGKISEATIERREYTPRKKRGETSETEMESESTETESTETESTETETETETPTAPTPTKGKVDNKTIITALTKNKVPPTKDNINAVTEMVTTGGVSLTDAIALLK